MSVLPFTAGNSAIENLCIIIIIIIITGGRTAEHALGFVGLSHMDSTRLSWAVCVSHGQCMSHKGSVCLTRAVCVSQMGSVCLTRSVRVSQGQCVFHIGSMCLTRAECVSHGQCVSHTDSRLCVTDQGDTGGHTVTSCQSVVGLGSVITREIWLCFNPTV